jgi:hypothetical protein
MLNRTDFEMVTSSVGRSWRLVASVVVVGAVSIHAAGCSSSSGAGSAGSNDDGGLEAGDDATTGDSSTPGNDSSTPGNDSSTPPKDSSTPQGDASMTSNDASSEAAASEAGGPDASNADASDASFASDSSDGGMQKCPAGLGAAGAGGCAVLGATLSGSGNQAHFFFDLPGTNMTGATVTATFIAPNATGGEIQTWLQNASTYALDAVSGFHQLSTLTSSWTTITLTTTGSTVTNEGRIGIDIEAGSSTSFEQPATVVYLASVTVTMPGDAAAPVGPYTFPNASSVSACVSDGGMCAEMYTSNLFLDVGQYDTNIPASLTWMPE